MSAPEVSSSPTHLVLRPLFARLGPVTRADGSAQLSSGATTVLCGIHGPAEVRQQAERTDRAAVEVVYRPKAGGSGARVADRAREVLVRGVVEAALLLQAHPRTAVHLALQQMDDDGGEAACCLNAACLAMVDAALPMRALFAAIPVAVFRDNDDKREKNWTVVVDPDRKHSMHAAAHLTVVLESTRRDVLATQVEEGQCSERQFHECVAVAREASKTVFEFYRECLTRKFSKDL